MKISAHWLRKFVDPKVDDHQLAADLTLAGIAIEGATGEGQTTVFEAEITTNRPDAMNHYGIAREIAAIYSGNERSESGKETSGLGEEASASGKETSAKENRVALKAVTPRLPEAKGALDFSVEIAEPALCARFTARGLRNVRVKQSPEPVRNRFALLGQKSINNAADATNYTLLELGHPTHAYDMDKLAGRKLIVRLARAGETLKTLDGVERKLHVEDLVIADAEKPVGLAGVMGGWDSMITTDTTNVLVEAAWFDPATVRKTARRHGMHTEASHRFERGADFGATTLACARVAELIHVSGGGELVGGEIDSIARKIGHPPVTLRQSEVTRILGKRIDAGEIERILGRLGFKVAAQEAGGASAQTGGQCAWKVNIPTWRLDVEREIDVIEEIARIHGYNNFENTLPPFSGGLVELPEAAARTALRRRLLALGYNEALSLTFVAKEESKRFSDAEAVGIANPLSEEAAAMRTTLVPGMLDMVQRNLNRGTDEVRLFDMAHIYQMNIGAAEESPSLVMAATFDAMRATSPLNAGFAPRHAKKEQEASTLLAFKGDVESALALFTHEAPTFATDGLPEYLHPARGARVLLGGQEVARFGELSPEVKAERKLKQPVYVAEIDAEKLFARGMRGVRYEKLSRFPAVDRDFSFTFPDEVVFERIRAAVGAVRIAELRSVHPVEIFRGGSVAQGNYSLLLRVTFQSDDHTLREEEITRWSEQVVSALTQARGVQRA